MAGRELRKTKIDRLGLNNLSGLDLLSLLPVYLGIDLPNGCDYRVVAINGAVLLHFAGQAKTDPVQVFIPHETSAHERLSALEDIRAFLPLWARTHMREFPVFAPFCEPRPESAPIAA